MKVDSASTGNKLLDRLPKASRQRLIAQLQPVDLEFKLILYEARAEIDCAYFALTAVLSAVVLMRDGRMIEVGTVGNEGGVGLPNSHSSRTSPNRVLVQIPGKGLRISVAALEKETREDSAMRELFGAHNVAFQFQVSQSVACNGLHQLEQRCCRWLLLTHDRVEGDEVPLTHEFLAVMLGVRRAGVTEILQSLQQRGLLTGARGKIVITNRKGMEKACCECYQDVLDEYKRQLG